MPMVAYRNYVAEFETVHYLKEVVETSCTEVILDLEIESLRPYEGAVKLRSDVLLHPKDQYTAALLRTIHKEFPTVLVLTPFGQQKSIATYFQLSTTSLESTLTPRKSNPLYSESDIQ